MAHRINLSVSLGSADLAEVREFHYNDSVLTIHTHYGFLKDGRFIETRSQAFQFLAPEASEFKSKLTTNPLEVAAQFLIDKGKLAGSLA